MVVVRLEHFLNEVRALRSRDPRVSRLSRFLEGYRQAVPAAPPPAQPRGLDPARLHTLVQRLGPALADHRSSGQGINPWTLAGLKRDEVRNAAVLAGLWSPHIAGDLARDFLATFLERISARADGNLPSRQDLAGQYSVTTEHCPVGNASERVDLLIEGRDWLFIVEVKIDAPEGLNQLQRYDKALRERGTWRAHTNIGMIFLAPYAPSSTINVVTATWADVAAAAKVVALRNQAAPVHRRMLITYAKHASTLGGKRWRRTRPSSTR